MTVYLVLDNCPSYENEDPIYGGYENYLDAEAVADRLNATETDPTWAMNSEGLDQYEVITIAINPSRQTVHV